MKTLCMMCLIAVGVFGCGQKPGAEESFAPDETKAGTTPSEEDLPALVLPPFKRVEDNTVQRSGDPLRGREALLAKDYVGCGIPASLAPLAFGRPAPEDLLPDRGGENANLAYNLTAVTRPNGTRMVVLNCLTCHAQKLEGTLVVGLGSVDGDFTGTQERADSAAQAVGFVNVLERPEYQKWVGRLKVSAPYTQMSTKGVNPADNLSAVLFAHRDPKTLAWSETALMEPPSLTPLPVDVPPWWRAGKKNALYYTSSGRGDHSRLMMIASSLCTDTVADAEAIDAFFPDIRAYVTSITPPAFPKAVDESLATKGKAVFNRACSPCHGTYGVDGVYETKVVPVEYVGTDPLLAGVEGFSGDRFTEWYAASFYGKNSRLEPQRGYVPPPLNGIWATAPFLHNGSVPTLAALLDSKTRPKFWTREFDGKSYDFDRIGWPFQVLEGGKASETDPVKQKRIYDTTLPGYSNSGHLFGDALSETQRAAVIEYLKTL